MRRTATAQSDALAVGGAEIVAMRWRKSISDALTVRTNKLIEAMFDASYFSKEGAATAERKSGFWLGGAGFSWKSVDRVAKGQFRFDYQRKDKITRQDVRFSDFSGLKFDSKAHVHVVEPGDWSLIAPRVFVNADMSKYSKILVTVRYGEKTPPITIPFSDKTEPNNQVPREWQPDKTRPAGEKFVVEYKLDAQLKNGVYTPEQIPKQEFESDWIKTDKSFIQISPETWKGPRNVRVRVKVLDDWEAKQAQFANVTLTWDLGGGKKFSKVITLKQTAAEQLFEDILTL